MTTISPESEKTLRQVFKNFNTFMVLLWRLGLGNWINLFPESAGQIMVLSHTGRKTGLKRRTPVNYALIDGEIYCLAGFGSISDWYRNLLANPEVEVWLPDGWYAGRAVDVTNEKGRLERLRAVLIASGFAAPLFGIRPTEMSDAELEAATRDYCLVRIERHSPRTGPGGPGDLSWVWPLATFILLPLVFSRRRRR